MAYLNCDQLVKCIEVYEYKDKIFLFLDYMEGGDLSRIILDKRGDLSEDFCKWTLYQVALGLQSMHSRNVLHRDIKSDNILCRPNGDIKIADMGFSVFLSEKEDHMTMKGTPAWMSPEISEGVTHSKGTDIYSYGCLAHELATGLPPFVAET